MERLEANDDIMGGQVNDKRSRTNGKRYEDRRTSYKHLKKTNMRASYSPNTPRPVAWLAFVEVLVRNFGVLHPMDNVVIVDASVTPAGALSSSIHVFRGQNGGDWILTITIDDDNNNLVSRRGFGHQVVPFNPQDYMEIDPFHVLIAYTICLFFL
ncbi:hypothetical protein PC9H_001694 [Pleurotus ostreatus]|uniref:Uncharacterized protein n=1 Tax=Pleurotus ostreatus TaxID=5322 RepID=A0A8H7AAY9_PLEOS|nr:uncharacterized protein PC9H_001694 [Pleurotus ostreatus]KAF7441345.1 hypothetical protein PC9H_001694 [Pleurotus ostreatus]